MKIREAAYKLTGESRIGDTEELIEEIATSLASNAGYLKYPGYGNGLLSLALFYAYYARYKKEKRYESLALAYFEESISAISPEMYDDKTLYFRDVIEIGMFIQFVKNEGLLHQINNDVLRQLDIMIGIFFSVKVKEGELNHYGALFAGEYFLTRVNENERAVDQLKQLVLAFERFAIKDESGYRWKWPFSKGDGIYLGLACGSSRVITLLASVYETGVLKSDCSHIINKAADFVLRNEQKPNPGLFSVKVENKERLDILLDGDLAIACGLWSAYKITKRDDLRVIIDKTLALACNRRIHADCNVRDASILYGTTGLALRFDRLYREMGQMRLKDSADFWYAASLDQRKFCNETLGFKAKYNQAHVYTNIAFHEGIAGIGIGLMCFVNEDLPLPTKLIG